MHRGKYRLILVLAACVTPVPALARDAEDPPPRAVGTVLPLDDFEAGPDGWKFVGGEEFPGAKGALARDAERAHGGQGSCRIDADFRGGGAYVGGWRELRPLGLPDIREFRAWVHARGLRRLGVRIVDDTGQCHQGSVDLPDGAGD